MLYNTFGNKWKQVNCNGSKKFLVRVIIEVKDSWNNLGKNDAKVICSKVLSERYNLKD